MTGLSFKPLGHGWALMSPNDEHFTSARRGSDELEEGVREPAM